MQLFLQEAQGADLAQVLQFASIRPPPETVKKGHGMGADGRLEWRSGTGWQHIRPHRGRAGATAQEQRGGEGTPPGAPSPQLRFAGFAAAALQVCVGSGAGAGSQ